MALFVNAEYISKPFRAVFDTVLNPTQHIAVPHVDPIFAFTANLEIWLSRQPSENGELGFSIVKSLLDALSGMVAAALLGPSVPLFSPSANALACL